VPPRPRRDTATLDLFDLVARARLAEELAAQARALICERLPRTEDQLRLPASAWRSPASAEREVSSYLGLLARAAALRGQRAQGPRRQVDTWQARERLAWWRAELARRGEELVLT
jgi:hypothetical protein